MKKLTIFSQFFKGYGPVYLLGVLILITINILFYMFRASSGKPLTPYITVRKALLHI